MKKKKIYENLSIKMLIIVYIFLNTSFLFSGISWKVSPMTFHLDINPADKLSKSFTVINTCDDSLELVVYINDYFYDEKGGVEEVEPDVVNRGLAGWIDFSPHHLTISPGEKIQVRFTITTPDIVPSGSYWANFYVEPFDKNKFVRIKNIEGRNVKMYLLPRYAVQLIGTVKGNLIKQGEITTVEVIPNEQDTSLVVHTKFKNTGNLILRCKGTVEVRDEMGETVKKIDLGGFKTYPEGIRLMKTVIPQTLKSGEYSVVVIIDFGGEFLVAGEAFFEITEEREEYSSSEDPATVGETRLETEQEK